MNRARVLLVVALAGCQPLAAPVIERTGELDAISALDAKVETLSDSVTAIEHSLAIAAASEDTIASEVAEHSRALGRVEGALVTLPDMLKEVCPRTPTPAAKAPECSDSTERIPVSGDKMIVGSREHVLVDPPGAHLVALVDTAFIANRLYVTDIVEFERDGKDWVRFNLTVPGESAAREVERQLQRRNRANSEVAGPLAISLRVTLGDVTDSYDFSLVERGSGDYQVRLGRSFLRDLALVDVSKRFVQPRAPLPSTAP